MHPYPQDCSVLCLCALILFYQHKLSYFFKISLQDKFIKSLVSKWSFRRSARICLTFYIGSVHLPDKSTGGFRFNIRLNKTYREHPVNALKSRSWAVIP